MRVIQITDCHLFAAPEAELLGVNTRHSLQAVLELVGAEQPQMEVLLATGDISQDASKESYQQALASFNAFGVPVYWLEGNHDQVAAMEEGLGAYQKVSPCVAHVGGWRIIMLDSSVPGEVGGEFAAADLEFLQKALNSCSPYHVMVCLHHHPVPIGCLWLDDQRVDNADEFFSIIDQYDNVRAVVWGHVHQQYEGERNHVKLFASPATSIQFKPQSDRFALDDVGPGYRWFELSEDGGIESGVSRVSAAEFVADLSATGY